VSGSTIDISRVSGGAALNADAVIVATDVAGALEIVSNTPAVPPDARHAIGHLETTSVIVIRLWFDPETPLADKPQSALTPLLPMIDAYFCLSKIVRDAAAGEHIVEVQLAAAKDHYLELEDASLVALALDDLHVVSADYRLDRLRASRVQRHINVFTAFRPGLEALELEAEVAEGVYVAGDWAPRPGNSWMMERAVSTGVARAADVLAAQKIDVPVEVEQPGRAGWLLRRSIVQRGFTVPDPMTEKQMIEHDRVDHVINGWACPGGRVLRAAAALRSGVQPAV
jgi:protoporphyrinogen oxidase